MEFSKLIAERYSVRAYRPDPIEDEKLFQVLEADAPGADCGKSPTVPARSIAHRRSRS